MSNALQTLRFEDTEVTALDCNTDEPVFVASPHREETRIREREGHVAQS